MKRCIQQHFARYGRAFAAMATALGLLLSQSAFALPTGWEVLEGNVSFDQQGSVLNVISQSEKAVVSYITFNLANGETVNFILPNATSSILNKVIGGQASSIAGVINSNGRIGLVNTAGIHLASTAQVQSAALLATTLNIADQDFFNDTMTLVKDGNGASVINEGEIDISKGGVALIAANNIINSGHIIAEDGSIHLAVGDKVTFHLTNNSSVAVTIDEGIKELVDDLNVAIGNNGYLKAHTVELKAKLADGVIANTINNDGIIHATAIANEGGQINILAEGGTNLVDNAGILYVGAWDGNNTAGTIRVKGNYNHNSGAMLAIGGEGEKGGRVEMLGDSVINEGSYIDVSGGSGGGTALIGGDFQGTGDTYRAVYNYADENTEVYADAINDNGEGGKIIFWSDGDTYNYANIVARGGLQNGHGGFAEVSGHEYLDFFGNVDLTAADGSMGTLLLDPANITIVEWNGPTDIANLRLWLDASDINGNGTAFTNGAKVSTWVDKSGNGFNATEAVAANQPTYMSTGLNGRSSVFFQNNATGLQGNITRPVGTANTWFLMGQYNSAGGSDKAFFEFNNGTPRQFFINNRYAGNITTDYAITQNTPISVYVQDPGGTSNFAIYQNGTALNTNARKTDFSTSMNNAHYTLGDDETGGNMLTGYISELVFFDRALTADEIDLMKQHTEAKWGVSQNINLANVSMVSDKYLEYLSQSSNISLVATNNITINNQSDNLLNLGNHTLSLTAGNNIVFNDVNDRIRTEGTNITMNAGGSMTLGILDTRGASGALNTGNVTLNGTGAGNISLAGGNVGGTFSASTTTGGNITVNNTDVVGTTTMTNAANTNGTISGSGNTFRSTATLNTQDNTGGNITMSADFRGNTALTGDRLQITDTAGDLAITTFSTGSGATSTIATNAGNLSLAGVNLNSTGATNAGRLDASASGNISINGTGWTTTNDIVNAWSTGGGNMSLSNVALTTTAPLTATAAAANPNQNTRGMYLATNGGAYTLTNVSVNNNTSIQAKNTITGTGNTFVGTTNFDANLGTAYNINITSSDFQNGTNVFDGANVTVADTNALAISGVTATGTGSFTATGGGNTLTISNANVASTTTMTSGGDITATSNDVFGTITATGNGDISIYETSSDINVNSITNNSATGTTGIWALGGGVIGKGTAVADITSAGTGLVAVIGGDSVADATGNVNMNIDSGGDVWALSTGANGSSRSLRLTGDIGGSLLAVGYNGGVTTTTGHIVLGDATDALNVTGTTTFSAANTRDVTGIGSYGGAVSGSGGRIGFTVNSGNFTSAGLTAANGTGWWGAADESLIINTVNGDILGTGYTTSGAANIRLQAGTTSSLLATNNINVNNVVSGQDLALYATGDSLGTGNGTAIQVGGTSTVAGTITASGFNASNYFSAANGAIDITLSSGNLNTALAWTQNDNINLTTTNGGIIQNFAKYGYNGKTIYTNGGDVTLTANGAGGYINTGVNALGAGSDLTAKAGGQNGGLSVQLYGRVDGNLTVHNTSGAGNAVTGNVNLGTSLGGSITNLDDTYTVQDVLGTTTVRALGDVGMYGMFIGAVSIYNANDVTIETDKGNVTVNTIPATGDIYLKSHFKSIIANTLQSTGGGNINLTAGSQVPRDKFSNIQVSNISTSGNLTAESYGTTTGSQSGTAINISGAVGGSKTTTTHTGGTVIIP